MTKIKNLHRFMAAKAVLSKTEAEKFRRKPGKEDVHMIHCVSEATGLASEEMTPSYGCTMYPRDACRWDMLSGFV